MFTTVISNGTWELYDMLYVQEEGTIILAGITSTPVTKTSITGPQDVYVAKYTLAGERQWITSFGYREEESNVKLSLRYSTQELFVSTNRVAFSFAIINAQNGTVVDLRQFTTPSGRSFEIHSVYAMKGTRDVLVSSTYEFGSSAYYNARLIRISGPALFKPANLTARSSSSVSDLSLSVTVSMTHLMTRSYTEVTSLSSSVADTSSLFTDSFIPVPQISEIAIPSESSATYLESAQAVGEAGSLEYIQQVSSLVDEEILITAVHVESSKSSWATKERTATAKSVLSTNMILIFILAATIFVMLIVLGIWLYLGESAKRAKEARRKARTARKEQNRLSAATFVPTEVDRYQTEMNTSAFNTNTFTMGNMTLAATDVDVLAVPGFLLIDPKIVNLDRLIAKGGGGEVYAGTVSSSQFGGSTFAIKYLPNIASDPQEIWSFKQELSIMEMLKSSPYFVKLFAFTEKPYMMVMQLYQDGTLHDWVRNVLVTTRDLLVFSDDIGSGLMHMHSIGVVHLDIKPSNILMEYSADAGRHICVISDFGLAQVIRNEILLVKQCLDYLPLLN